jgi:Na+/glutamate symporter
LIGGVAGAHLAKHLINKHPEDKEKREEELKQDEELVNGIKEVWAQLAK